MDILNDALRQGIAPAIVVALYLIITKIIDSRKENVQIKLSSELTKSVNTISNFIVDLTKNVIEKDKDKCKAAIEDSIYASAARLISFVTRTLINNHVDINKETILINIHNIINAEFYKVYSTLSLYKFDDKFVSDFLMKEWKDEVEQGIIDVIYNNTLSKEDKIQSFINRINIKYQSYIIYIINNTIH